MSLRPRRITWQAAGIAGVAGVCLLLSLPDDTAPAAAVSAPPQPDALLRPCEDPGPFLPRQQALQRAVADVQPTTPVLELVVRPSFHPVQLLQLYPRDGQWYVGVASLQPDLSHMHHRQADSPPVKPREPASPKLEFQERVVAEDTAARMVLEWRRSVQTTHTEMVSGLDGISYVFYFDGQCAQMWSPGPGSRNDRLADVVHALLDQAPDAELVRHLQAVGAPRRPNP